MLALTPKPSRNQLHTAMLRMDLKSATPSRTTNTTISNNLRMSIFEELLDSKTEQSRIKMRDPSSRIYSIPPLRAHGLSKSHHQRSASEVVGDYDLNLDSKSLASTPTHLTSQKNLRPCLKMGYQRTPSRRKPPSRSVSEDQLRLEVRLPGRTKTVTRTRSITFDERVRVRRVPSMSELSEGNTNKIWFQSQEYDTIKRKTYNLIRAVQQGETGGDTYCTRGLEKYFDADTVQRRRAHAWNCVFSEQEGQRRNGKFDDIQISENYRAISSESLADAAARAKMDEASIGRCIQYTKSALPTHGILDGASKNTNMSWCTQCLHEPSDESLNDFQISSLALATSTTTNAQ